MGTRKALPGRALDEISKRGWLVFKVEPLSVDDRKELLSQFLRDYGRNLSRARIDRIVAAPQSATRCEPAVFLPVMNPRKLTDPMR